MYLTAALVLVIVVGSGAYAWWLRANPRPVMTALSSPMRQESKVEPAPPVAAPLPREVDSGIHIRLSAIETTWLSIIADGKQTYSGILEASQTKILEGRETARIKTGNAGGVTIVFNGKELGPMGRHGETRTVLFTKTGYEVIRSAAEALIPALFAPHRALPLSRIVE
jgi:cytoskeleton protein RodZ